MTASANSRSSSACSSIFSLIVSQPSRLPISGTPGPPQSDSSLLPDALRHVLAWACSTRSAIGGSSSSGIEESIVGGRPVTIPSRVELDARDQRVERLDELVDALAQQLLGHVAHVDAGVGERCEVLAGSWSAVAPADLELLGAGEQRRHRHRVDRVRRHQRVDVLGLGVARVLHAGRGPQRALHGAPASRRRGEALALEELLEAL